MAISVAAATDINTLLGWVMGRHRHGEPVTLEDATAAARRLAGTAHRKLMAGLTPADVTLDPREPDVGDVSRYLAHHGVRTLRHAGAGDLTRRAGAMPAEIDGMPVRAAFPAPPGDEDAMECWTVILRESTGPRGGRYRLCRVRRAGARGDWEVSDGMPGAQDLAWTLAAIWFARAVQIEAGIPEPPQEDRHPPR
jgi:hypothetical protein